MKMELLAMAVYGWPFLKRKETFLSPAVYSQADVCSEAQGDARKSKGDPQLCVLFLSDAHGV